MKKIILPLLLLLSTCAFANTDAAHSNIQLSFKVYADNGKSQQVIAKLDDSNVSVPQDNNGVTLTSSDLTTREYLGAVTTSIKKQKNGQSHQTIKHEMRQETEGRKIDVTIIDIKDDLFKIQYTLKVSEILGFKRYGGFDIEAPDVRTRIYQFSVIAPRGKAVKQNLSYVFNPACGDVPSLIFGSKKAEVNCSRDTPYFIDVMVK